MITLIREVEAGSVITYDDLLIGNNSKNLSDSFEFKVMIMDQRVSARNNLKKGRLLEYIDIVIK